MESLYSNVVKNIRTSLYEPYQVDGCKWMLSREIDEEMFYDTDVSRGGILADEVGLGKTLMSICMIVGNPKQKTLILLPKSLIHQWKEQILKFTNHIKITIVENNSVLNEKSEGVFLMSQSLINSKNTIIGNSPAHTVHWDRIIIDEAHILRNNKSKMFNACCLLKTDIRWALTATPVVNRMTDFVHIMSWFNVSQYLCQTEKETVASKFILRRTKQDVAVYNKALILPDCEINVKHIPFHSVDEKKMYIDVFTQERKKVMNSNNKTITDLLEHLLRIRQLCIHPQLYLDGMSKKSNMDCGNWSLPVTKLECLLDDLKKQPPYEKTLVFCQFIKEMNIYEERLTQEGYNVVRLDGSMNIEERNIVIKRFKKNPDINIFLIQINTGGQGINLQNANHIYIMSPSWNPAIEHQAIGRCHRTGQKNKVYVTKYVISSFDKDIPFIEENMMKLQEKKKEIIADILKDERIINDGTNYQFEDYGDDVCNIKAMFNLSLINKSS
jgi:SNF2 family DNA or RNA helicase